MSEGNETPEQEPDTDAEWEAAQLDDHGLESLKRELKKFHDLLKANNGNYNEDAVLEQFDVIAFNWTPEDVILHFAEHLYGPIEE